MTRSAMTALAAALLLLVNIRFRGWIVPAAGSRSGREVRRQWTCRSS